MRRIYKHFNFSRLLAISCLILCINQTAAAQNQTRARYNLAGYAPTGAKRIIILSDIDYQNQSWTFKNSNGVTVLNGQVGTSLTSAGIHTPKAFNHVVDFSSISGIGNYTVNIGSIPSFTVSIKNATYGALAHDILRSLRARRSGSNDAIVHAFSHGEDATAPIYTHDGSTAFKSVNWTSNGSTANMLGGWYDAGDYIKFTMTTAYTAYNILLSYHLNPEMFDGVKNTSQSSWNDMLDETKWGLDYLMKTLPDNSNFIIQVADEQDHNVGSRLPENDTNSPRPALSIKSRYQMAQTAAALALGYTVFKDKDASLAITYLDKAIEIYAAAKTTTIASGYFDAVTNAFYKDDLPNDQMCLAATELYIATQQSTYLTDAESYIGADNWSSWANLTMKANYRLAPYSTTAASTFAQELSSFKATADQAANIWNLPHAYVWGSLYSQFGVGASAFAYQLLNEGDLTYQDMAMGVIDYTFGLNNWGLGFVASQSYPGAIETSYAQIFKLQPSIFPTGEIAEGPAPTADHVAMQQFFPHDPNLAISGAGGDKFSDFNTTGISYFENKDDFVCSETTIAGLADGIFLMAIADKVLSDGNPPNAAPSVSIATSTGGNQYTIGDNIILEAIASDSDGSVTKVAFYEDGNLLGEDTSSPYSYNWASATIGNHSVTAIATDDDGATTSSVALSITVNVQSNNAPTVSITSPTNGASYTAGGTIVINANASDTDGTVTQVEFFSNGISIGTDDIAPYSVTIASAVAGSYSYTATATDDQSASTTSSAVSVTVDVQSNNAPSVSITSPANGASYTAGGTIVINANASDTDGTVTQVEFFSNGISIGTDDIAPYSVTIASAVAGSYSYTATATDDQSASTTSSAVSVSVDVISGQTPFSGSPMAIPGTIEVENFDNGGQDIAFNEGSSTNQGGQYRTSENVDIELCNDINGGYNVGWITNGEWLEYTVNVSLAGNYDFAIRSATEETSSKTISISIDGSAIISNQSLPNTGGWQTWQTVTVKDIALSAGEQVLRLEFESDNYNVNYVEISASTVSNVSPTVSITSPVNGTSYTEGDNVIVNANASDSDGTVTQVEFFSNGISLGTDSSAPYSFTMTSAVAGSFAYTAVATDNAGASTTSTVVNLTVSGSSNDPCLFTAFGVPRSNSMPELKNSALDNVYVIGNSSDFANLGLASFHWDQASSSLWYFAFSTTNGSPGWWVPVTEKISHTLGSVSPTITFNNSNIPGLDGSTYYVNEYNGGLVLVHNSGDYAILFSATAGAPQVCSNNVRAVLAEEQSKVIQSTVAVFPNPVHGILNIKSDHDIHMIQLYHVDGRIAKAKVGSNLESIDVSYLTPGVYLIQLESDQAIVTKRFVKK